MTIDLQTIKPGKTIHLMGICGTAMASLAGLLKDLGFKVTGSDQNPYPPMSTQLENLGISIMKGYQAENLAHRPDLVIVGNVISKTNPEAQELLRLGLPFTSLPKALGHWAIGGRESLVVSGTHGKTTTTSLLAWVAEKVGVEPGFLIGGIPKNFSLSFRNPKKNHFIIEGDEYDTAYFDKVPKFIHYQPKHVILTSIEFDHADIYADLNAVKAAFQRLLALIPENGTLLYNGRDKNISDILSSAPQVRNKFSYGSVKSDYIYKVVSYGAETTTFQVFQGNRFLGEFATLMTGEYNVMNATAVIGLADQLGWPIAKVSEALRTFQGVRRRQEIIGEPRGITIIEDFAHHPTAVRETILAIQNKYPGRKVFSVFEPRSATSRRKVFQGDYVEAFKEGHEVLIAEAYDQTKIDETERFSVAELVEDLKNKGCLARSFSGADNIVDYLGSEAKSSDIILIMSNGGFDGIYQKLLKRLETPLKELSL